MDPKLAFLEEISSMNRDDIEKIFDQKRVNIRTKKIYPLIILGKGDTKEDGTKDSKLSTK